jgi:hypothetical protein
MKRYFCERKIDNPSVSKEYLILGGRCAEKGLP